MARWDDLKPDTDFLKRRLSSLRLEIERYMVDASVLESPILKRMEFEFLLMQVQTQEGLIDILERSIVSQDKFSKTANFLAFSALILAAVEILVAIFKP